MNNPLAQMKGAIEARDHLKDIGLPFDDAYALAVQMRGH